ncbi:nucleotidyltransferase domain-containing protein [Candidatus Woesearchaeota archaeon]|nr:nucleotidyltransferase domain-containing protein [Candidatus Woesearchaeota archaeon]
MMLKRLKKYLSKEIFDIVIYGSSVKGKMKPGDIDIAVIFSSGSLDERLTTIQKIRKDLDVKVDIKAILLHELFRPEFFSRTGIFLEGISVRHQKPFSRLLGFTSSALFSYDLKDKTHTEKVKFNYVLSGRGRDGIVKMLDGDHIAPGVIEIPIENSDEFAEILKSHKINYGRKNILKA